MSIGRERIQVLEGVRIWQTRKVNVREVGVLTEFSIVPVVTSGDLHHAAGPIYFSSRKFDSTSLLNRMRMRRGFFIYFNAETCQPMACAEVRQPQGRPKVRT